MLTALTLAAFYGSTSYFILMGVVLVALIVVYKIYRGRQS